MDETSAFIITEMIYKGRKGQREAARVQLSRTFEATMTPLSHEQPTSHDAMRGTCRHVTIAGNTTAEPRKVVPNVRLNVTSGFTRKACNRNSPYRGSDKAKFCYVWIYAGKLAIEILLIWEATKQNSVTSDFRISYASCSTKTAGASSARR